MKIIEKNEDVCLLNNATTHTILHGKEYFSNLTMRKVNVHTISGPIKIIEGSENAMIILSNGTTLHLKYALLSSRLKMNVLSFKDVHQIGTILK